MTGGGNGGVGSNDLMTIPITKGGMGFGFTIADSGFGQKVKKILDRPRCKNLQEGDVLIEINNTTVKNMSHSEVVQVRQQSTIDIYLIKLLSPKMKLFIAILGFIFILFPRLNRS